MRKIAVIGTGYVGLVTGVCLAEIGHHVICVDTNHEKIDLLRKGISPIYEPGMAEMIADNIHKNCLTFTTCHNEAFQYVDIIFIAVGTPQKEDGSADLTYIFQAAEDICKFAAGRIIIVTKSTVPVGTNEKILNWIRTHSVHSLNIEMVSNPEFLREGHAIYDTFHGDRIIVGSDNTIAAAVMEEIYSPFNIEIFHTNLRSAEMIKYASNAFLATKISFINEIASICEKLGANIDEVASGMGKDTRIGSKFLQAGIGYGGSCFPKDTKALVQIAGDVEHTFDLLESVIRINNHQQIKLVQLAKERFGNLAGMRVAVLGLSFKPGTDDIREAASIMLTKRLVEDGAIVTAFDPIAINNAKRVLPNEISYTTKIKEALQDAEVAFIVTEWNEIKALSLEKYEKWMKNPVIFDGRNCYPLQQINKYSIEYHSIGRPTVKNRKVKALVE